MKNLFRPAFGFTLFFMLLTGIAYPLAITGAAQILFPAAANGSLVEVKGVVIGSALIGQTFASDRYFHGRPSAAGKDGYDATASSGTNLATSSKALVDAVKQRVADLGGGPVPADLVTSSASGLDPDISPASALWQVARVAKARSLPEEAVKNLVAAQTLGPQLGFLGDPRVNVLALNMELDRINAAP